jgi:hypothetical protein
MSLRKCFTQLLNRTSYLYEGKRDGRGKRLNASAADGVSKKACGRNPWDRDERTRGHIANRDER